MQEEEDAEAVLRRRPPPSWRTGSKTQIRPIQQMQLRQRADVESEADTESEAFAEAGGGGSFLRQLLPVCPHCSADSCRVKLPPPQQ